MVTLQDSESFLNVDTIVGGLGIVPGQHVADFGCGTGFFTIALAKAVGANGMVTALDVMVEPLDSVAGRAEGLGMKNVATVRADLEVLGGTKLADNSQDMALLKHVLFQSQKQDAMIAEAARVTKPGGRVVAIDWKKGAGGFGPPDELRPEAGKIQEYAKMVGLRLERELPLGQYHFGLVFMK